MSSAFRQVQPSLHYLPQKFNPWVWWVFSRLLPPWLRWKMKIRTIEAENLEQLAHLYQQFQAGQGRLILAFRHPSTDDPLCMGYLLWHLLPRQAKKMGVRLRSPVNSYFIYDRGIPLWAGNGVGWLFARLGGSSIMRGKLDTQALRSARQLLLEGDFPLAAAPEGSTNDHSERVAPLEPGVAQLGFWCLEDLEKAGRSQPVYIVPIGIQYFLAEPSWETLATVMTELEQKAGCPISPLGTDQESLYRRLFNLALHLLDRLEDFYATSYRQTFPPLPELEDANEQMAARLQRLLNVILEVAEGYFGLKAATSFVDRCRRLEQAAWDRMYRSDTENLSVIEKGLANWLAEEANVRLRHMRLAERFTSVTGSYVREKPSMDRFGEVLLILWRTFSWIEGTVPDCNTLLGPRRVKMTIGEPIAVHDYWPTYHSNRKSARQSVQDVTAILGQRLEGLII